MAGAPLVYRSGAPPLLRCSQARWPSASPASWAIWQIVPKEMLVPLEVPVRGEPEALRALAVAGARERGWRD